MIAKMSAFLTFLSNQRSVLQKGYSIQEKWKDSVGKVWWFTDRFY